jgi:hypothetical protein
VFARFLSLRAIFLRLSLSSEKVLSLTSTREPRGMISTTPSTIIL